MTPSQVAECRDAAAEVCAQVNGVTDGPGWYRWDLPGADYSVAWADSETLRADYGSDVDPDDVAPGVHVWALQHGERVWATVVAWSGWPDDWTLAERITSAVLDAVGRAVLGPAPGRT